MWEKGWVFSRGVRWTAGVVLAHVHCTLESGGPAAETLEASEMQSVSPGLGLHSTMLKGLLK